ncbi:MAG TPA: amidohydrolase family protein, partial [Longimicrobiales bacterium]|nr:amidohydrolase family protein [Longimicrobiales bacterium]
MFRNASPIHFGATTGARPIRPGRRGCPRTRRPRRRRILLALLAVVPAACSRPSPDFAERVFVNAKILTMDEGHPRASALAIRGEALVAVGDRSDVGPWMGPDTRVSDLEGRTVLPGLVESHIHVRDLGFERNTAVNLTPAGDVDDVSRLLAERLERLRAEDRLCCWTYPTTAEAGPWLFGLGWTQDRLEGSRMADRHDLDAVSRDVPISLDRIYRGVAVNTRVFELHGWDFDDPATWPDWFRRDPPDFGPGEIILRDSTGLPSGIFLGEEAPRLVAGAIPGKSLDQEVQSLLGGMEYLASLGITALVEAGSRMGEVTRVYQEAYDRRGGRLPVRAVVYDGWYRSGDPEGLGDPERIRERLDGL